MLRFTLVLSALAALTAADIGCTLQDIHLGRGTITATSTDTYYQAGDIFYQQCSANPRQPYIGWCPHPSDDIKKIQINIPQTTAIHALVFQSTYAKCPTPDHNYKADAYLETFDMQYVLAGDNTGTLVTYDKDLPALDGTSSEKRLSFAQPLVTNTLQLIVKSYNMYPCFRFKIIGCPASELCSPGYCLNGGKCAGKDFCSCPPGFTGNKCELTAKDIVAQDYGFQSMEGNLLTTPSGIFEVTGDVTLDEDKRRAHHGHSHGHSCHFHSTHHHGHHQHSYCTLQNNNHHGSSNHSSSNHGNNHHQSHCMSGLSNHHSGFTTSLNVQFGHNHHGHHYLFSNGGNLHGHNGCSLSYNTHTQNLHFHVQTSHHHWSVNINFNLHQHGHQHNIACSWHPHTGAHLTINNQVKSSCGHPQPTAPQPTSPPTTQAPVQTTAQPANTSLPLALGYGYTLAQNVNLNVSVNVNMSMNSLTMLPLSQSQLNNVGYTTTAAPPTATTKPTTTPVKTTTLPPITATSPTTAAKNQLPVFTTAPTTVKNQLPVFTTAPTTTAVPSLECHSYQNQPTIGAQSTTTTCKTGDVCTLYKDTNGYTAKCLEKSQCEAGRRIAAGSCWECCDSYLCNSHCSASTSLVCADTSQCAVLLGTGYDVCKDPINSVTHCRKTCHLC